MKGQAQLIEKRLIEGKVFKGGATWRKLEKFFEKSRETLITDLFSAATAEEANRIIKQIEANEHYQENVRIIDPACFESGNEISSFFALNSKLCTISGAESNEIAKALMALNYLMIFSQPFNDSIDVKYETFSTFTQKEKNLFRAYDYFKNYGKKVLLLTSEEEIIKKAQTLGIDVAKYQNITE